MNLNDPTLDHLAVARRTLLEPYGLDESHLGGAIATILEHRVDHADLYFQYTRSEGWSLDEGIVKSGSFNIDQGVGVRAISGEKTAFAYSDDISSRALGDAANAELLAAIEELAETYGGDRRWRIEHAQIVDPADIATFGKHGIIASMQPVHQTSDRLMAEARLGPDRLGGAYAWASIEKSGARLAFGSDAPVESPDPFAGWATAFTREDAQGQPFGGWLPQERVTREEALAGFSADAAYAGFAEDRFGRLVIGEWADFVVLDRDPMLASAGELRQAKVLETWVAGRRVYSSAEK